MTQPSTKTLAVAACLSLFGAAVLVLNVGAVEGRGNAFAQESDPCEPSGGSEPSEPPNSSATPSEASPSSSSSASPSDDGLPPQVPGQTPTPSTSSSASATPSESPTGSPDGSPSSSASASPSDGIIPTGIVPTGLPGGSESPSPSQTPTASPGDEPGARCDVDVSIGFHPKGADDFRGRIRSDAPECERDRKVALKRFTKGSKRDPKVGSDVTNNRGRWKEKLGRDYKERAKYYAKVKAAVVETRDGTVNCGGARSSKERPR